MHSGIVVVEDVVVEDVVVEDVVVEDVVVEDVVVEDVVVAVSYTHLRGPRDATLSRMPSSA